MTSLCLFLRSHTKAHSWCNEKAFVWGMATCNGYVERQPKLSWIRMRLSWQATDRNTVHSDGRPWVVSHCWHVRDAFHNGVPFYDAGKNWVSGLAGRKPIEETVVVNIEEHLRAAAVGLPGVCHCYRTRQVAVFRSELVLNVAAVRPLLLAASLQVFEETGTCTRQARLIG